MYVDSKLLFSDAQAITAAAGSTNTIDLGIARNIGVGEPLYVVCVVDVAFTDAGSDSSLAVALEGDSTTSFTPDSTKNLFTIPAEAAIGDKFIARISPDDLDLQYGRLKYTPANGSLTTGSVTAFITNNIDAYTSYANNSVIS